jgi:hypothetical protein
MSSELRVNILRGSTANGNITIQGEGTSNLGGATMQLQQGLAKVFSSITYSGATPTDQNSLNVSSVAYQAVGQLDVNFTNAFGDTYYAGNVSKRNTVNNDSAEVVIRDAAGQVDLRFFESGATADDPVEVNFVAHGDLA